MEYLVLNTTCPLPADFAARQKMHPRFFLSDFIYLFLHGAQSLSILYLNYFCGYFVVNLDYPV